MDLKSKTLSTDIESDQVHFGVAAESWCFILFSFRSSGYKFGCTIAAVSTYQLMEHVKNALQNITTEWMPQSVEYIAPFVM